MIPSRAKEILEMFLHKQCDLKRTEFAYSQNEVWEAVNTALEVLERHIPKELTHEATLYKCCTCPTCKNVVNEFVDFKGQRVRVTYAHCRFCGQALDWSDTE